MAPPPDGLGRDLLGVAATGLALYVLTSILPVLGVVIGNDLAKGRAATGSVRAFVNWDGGWYQSIVENGYEYDPDKGSSVAFFPAFPMLGRGVVFATGLSADAALLLVSHVCLALTFILLSAYLYQRFALDSSMRVWSVLAFGLFPTAFFFRVAYSESLFALLLVLTLYGMERQWPEFVLALIIGLATATRSVGVVLLAPFFMHLLSTSGGWKWGVVKSVLLLPLSLWGILAFILFQWIEFDEPLAFVLTQKHWRLLPPPSFVGKLISALSLEPIWTVFQPSSPCYWRSRDAHALPIFSFYLANPFYFLVTAVFVGIGAFKGILNRNEVLLAAGLLLIPYVMKGPEIGMVSMARFAAIVFPSYLVIGYALARMPMILAIFLAILSCLALAIYSAHFGAGRLYYY